MLTNVIETKLRQFSTQNGEVRHALKESDDGFCGFGEAYLSAVTQGAVKGWKRHQRMTLNLIVVVGEIRFVIYDDAGNRLARNASPNSSDAYIRLTVPPGLWLAFGGVAAGKNLLLNIADITHDPQEAETRNLASFDWIWSN